MKTNSEVNLKKRNFIFMNRIRNKFYKPLLEQKRGRHEIHKSTLIQIRLLFIDKNEKSRIIHIGSVSRRKIGGSLSKVGEVYGVVMSNGTTICLT